jgi:hypothetical protein
MAIQLTTDEAKFLSAALDAKHTSLHLRYYLMTDKQKLVTTDGFRAHVVATEVQCEPGFYVLDKERTRLNRVADDDVADARKEFYLMKNLGLDRIVPQSVIEANPSVMYCVRNGEFDNFSCNYFPRHKGKRNTSSHMTFRRGKIMGQERAVCLGINAYPVVWQEDGTVAFDNGLGTIALDSNFILDALSTPMVRPVMRWTTPRSPAIIGDMGEAHAIVMPIYPRYIER